MKPEYDIVNANKTIFNHLQKVIATIYSLLFFLLILSEKVGRLEITESFFWN